MSFTLPRRRFLAGTAAAGMTAFGLACPAVLRAAGGQWGDLFGRFVYDGKAPERKKTGRDFPLSDGRDSSSLI